MFMNNVGWFLIGGNEQKYSGVTAEVRGWNDWYIEKDGQAFVTYTELVL
jgi:hypothetical protein